VWICFAVSLSLAPSRAIAQTKNGEISGGYSFYHEPDLSVPAGWYASGGGYLNNWLGFVGEVSGHYKTVTESGVNVKTNIHLFGVGPKFAPRRNPRFTPYVQALFGGGRANASASLAGQSFDESSSGFAYQPSAGVEINNTSGTVGIRVAVARAAIHVEDDWVGGTMFMAGVVIRR
jgi:hypothetical protein